MMETPESSEDLAELDDAMKNFLLMKVSQL